MKETLNNLFTLSKNVEQAFNNDNFSDIKEAGSKKENRFMNKVNEITTTIIF